MAQLRQEYDEFVRRDAEVVVVGPDDAEAFRDYWEREEIRFIGLPDPDHTVADLYHQQVKRLKLGRLPALMIIDRLGRVRYRHYGGSMSDIPPNDEVLSVLDALNREFADTAGRRQGTQLP